MIDGGYGSRLSARCARLARTSAGCGPTTRLPSAGADGHSHVLHGDAQSGGLIMSDSGSGYRGGASGDGGSFQPHAFDPWAEPELFRGVLSRRVFAFLIDMIVLSIPVILALMFIAVFGLITLGLGWVLFWLVSPATVILAVIY